MRKAGLFGFIAFLPISIAFAQMCLSLLALSCLLEMLQSHSLPRPQTPLNHPLIWYLGLVLVTTLFSQNVWKSVRGLDGLLTISAFYLVYLSIKDRAHLKTLLAVLLLSITLAAIYGILQHDLQVDPFRLTKPISLLKHVNDDLKAPVRISAFFSSYMTFSGQLAMAIPLLCACLFLVNSPLKKGLLAVSLFLASLALLWTYTRSGWLGMLCALLPFGYVKNKKITLVVIFSLIIGLFSLYVIEQQEIINVHLELVERVLSIFRTKEYLERLYTWKNSLDIIKDYPLTGIGKKNFSHLVDQYRIPYGDFDFSSRAHAHNNLLQVAVESGIPALICFLWLWSVMFRTMYQTYQRLHAQGRRLDMLALGCLGALIAFFVQGGFEHNFGDSEAAMMMWTIMALGMKLSDMAFQSATPVE